MTLYRTQITLLMTSGTPADSATNTWYCLAVDDTGANNFAAAVIDFHKAMRTYYSPLVAQLNHVYKTYDMTDPEPRAPIQEGTWSFPAATSGSPLPTEVACVLSFQGTRVSGQSQARRRGRIYIGPLATTTADSSARPTGAFTTAVATAAKTLVDSGEPGGSTDWAIYSPTSSAIAGIPVGVQVVNGWIDNEFDTQRRRGRKATTRTSFVD